MSLGGGTPFSPSLERTFRGHRSGVLAASFHPGLQQVASGSLDGNVMVWNFKPTMRAFRFVGHRGPVNDVAFSPQGSLIASCSADSTIRFWIPTVKGECSMIKAHASAVRSLAFERDSHRLVTGGDDKAVKVWNTVTQRFELSFPGHQNWVRCVDFSRDGRLCASGGDDKILHVWDVSSRKATHSFYDHTDSITCLSFHPDANCIAAGSADRTINVWDLRMNQLLQHYDAHSATVNAVDFHPSGSWLLSAGDDGTSKLWDLKEGFLYCTLTAHEGAVHDVKFSPCGRQFCTSGADALLMVWNSNMGGFSRPVRQMSPSGRVDPTNMILSPEAQEKVTPKNVSRLGQANASGARSSRPGSKEGRPAVAPPAEPQYLPVQPAQVQRTTTRPSSAPHVSEINVTAEMPIEQLVRQVDITAATQQILANRMAQSEATAHQLQENIRDRDERVGSQLEVVLKQLQNFAAESAHQRQELNQLKESMATQSLMLQQLLAAQKKST